MFNDDLSNVVYVCFLVPYSLTLVCFVVDVLVLRLRICTLCFLCVVTRIYAAVVICGCVFLVFVA
jgi:hypothetical protein